MKSICTRCGLSYDEGFYAQHRVTNEHITHITYRQARYGNTVTFCNSCGKPYAPGDATEHKFTMDHLVTTAWGRIVMKRREAIQQLERRDAYILAGVRSGKSYGELSRELMISRQRVHQIATKLGVQSTAKRDHRPAPVRTCFFDGKAYSDWTIHSALKTHTNAVEEFTDKVGGVRRAKVVTMP